MKLRISAAILALALSAGAAANAQVSYDQHGFASAASGGHAVKDMAVSQRHRAAARHPRNGAVAKVIGDPRPRAWCGWWARQQLGIKDRKYNLARNWAVIGTPANGPAPGVIAVWRHHVGFVTAVPGPGRIVLKSGNDGRAVRERERSTRGIIAYRWPPGFRLAMQ